MRDASPMSSGVRRAAVALALPLLVAGSVGGCAADPDPSPPAGVDELTIPSPSPDPDDFVDDVDNPWLALGPGESATLTGVTSDVAVTVGAEPTAVGGVPVTSLDVGDASYLLAQDREGNVWQVVEGEPAGLFLPATPRYGDGWGVTYAGDEATVVAEVSELEGDTLEITTTHRDDARGAQVATYEKDVGLVRLETASGVFTR